MLNPRGPVPLYNQLADVLRKRIDDGALQPGALVPSEADLVSEFGVARITARRAIRELRDAGIIYTIRGEGSYVGPESASRQARSGWRFQTIADDLAAKVRAGDFEQDVPLPSETQLAQQYDVAKGTVRRALTLLRDQRLVYTVPGRGTYPTPPDPKRGLP
ncbi:GntR family transcriptional regulator [Nonomuraea angiospora]|uniref:DNA-binding GntR family transcriptional regulator n=1 Tax=Nonomuraea angiospora TaxID=46172 RepID=A0ABR9MDC9_9ACTN|nr:GntR family transcriptional regulator [Nonomuraea angiospora]MBE1590929.1 DNA-binding GntR family transcriptional regulator [Nonomuraea angiospora]